MKDTKAVRANAESINVIKDRKIKAHHKQAAAARNVLEPKPVHTDMTMRKASSSRKNNRNAATLAGADLYVARFHLGESTPERMLSGVTSPTETPRMPAFSPERPPSILTPPSLHDELINPYPTTSPVSSSLLPQPPVERLREIVRPSRPCYRCIAYMHAVGIKRVFWSDSQGKWMSRKVRDLMEELRSGECDVYATKWEVLLMKHQQIMQTV